MKKITEHQMNLLREEIIRHADRRVFGGFKAWVELWCEHSDKTANPHTDFIQMGIDGWAGYGYRQYANIFSIYKNCCFDATMTIDEFYMLFDRLWISTAVKIIMKEICSSSDELAY